MKFDLLDAIVAQSADRIVAVKQVAASEEYLQDHFPAYPVLPGVFMIETMVQAARRLLADRGDPRLVLGRVRALKFGAMIRPGEAIEVEVQLTGIPGDGTYECRGVGRRRSETESSETAVSGRFTMRPIRRPAHG